MRRSAFAHTIRISRVPFLRRSAAALLFSATLAGCWFGVGPPPQQALRSTVQEVFWRRLTQLCGRAFEGRMAEGADSVFVRNRLVMHVRDCRADEVRIGFVIGPDPSRTWVVRRVDGALALTHEVAGDAVSGYGGVTRDAGTPERQDFAADSATARMLPPAAHNVWSLEILDGRTFAYTVGRPGVRQRFRLEFDLRHAVASPES
ncbi:hypothetical protein [Longimicrobium sp.]|uniref:hypothetical protein n=1 Tax=Longimicrobium sp. TaxID=2029185 RepID=UPI002BA1FF65|nr:hypothetical protein [Longimicrobium sp.]HSU15071.1 hypothetical protein [Longimicrobium sp.]